MNKKTEKLLDQVKDVVDTLDVLPLKQRWDAVSDLQDYIDDKFRLVDHELAAEDIRAATRRRRRKP